MLIRFAVKNFLSIKEVLTLTMVAGNSFAHESHVRRGDGLALVKGAFLFGANASGKSSIIKAIEFFRRCIANGLGAVDFNRKWFRLARDRDDIGSFAIDIKSRGHIYHYALDVSYSKVSVVEEKLVLMDDVRHAVELFHRRVDEQGRDRISRDEIRGMQPNEARRFEIYREDFRNGSFSQKTFLADVAGRCPQTGGYWHHYGTVFSWFRRMLVIFPETKFGDMSMYARDEDARMGLGGMLRNFDTGIESLDLKEVTEDTVLRQLNEEKRKSIRQEMKSDLSRALGKTRISLNVGSRGYLVKLEDGELKYLEVVANHGNSTDLFERRDESDGTQRLYDLLPLQECFKNNGVIFVDELDRSLHAKATREFIRLFFENSYGSEAQLIATSQEPSLMTLEMLRDDEMWIVERDKEHQTKIRSMSGYDLEYICDAAKDYLLGRFGGIPSIRHD